MDTLSEQPAAFGLPGPKRRDRTSRGTTSNCWCRARIAPTASPRSRRVLESSRRARRALQSVDRQADGPRRQRCGPPLLVDAGRSARLTRHHPSSLRGRVGRRGRRALSASVSGGCRFRRRVRGSVDRRDPGACGSAYADMGPATRSVLNWIVGAHRVSYGLIASRPFFRSALARSVRRPRQHGCADLARHPPSRWRSASIRSRPAGSADLFRRGGDAAVPASDRALPRSARAPPRERSRAPARRDAGRAWCAAWMPKAWSRPSWRRRGARRPAPARRRRTVAGRRHGG